MVQVRVQQPLNTDGSLNLDAWLDHAISIDPALERQALKEACEVAQTRPAPANPNSRPMPRRIAGPRAIRDFAPVWKLPKFWPI